MKRSERSGTAMMPVVFDVSLVAVLLMALAIVFQLDRSSPDSENRPAASTIEVREPPPSKPRLRLAVTPETPEFDDMGKLLDTLGDGYRYRKFKLDDLLDSEQLAQCDILFITCSGLTSKWLAEQVGGALRGGNLYAQNEATFRQAKTTLREYVEKGGVLYASDLHYSMIQKCFDDFADIQAADVGAIQSINAEVVDPALREIIGSELELKFDQESWRPAAFAGETVSVLLRGNYRSEDGRERNAPLLIKFPYGKGMVIFTSFHNEKQNNEAETKLLKYLVFSAVTAGTESEVAETMMRSGFSNSKRNLFSASRGDDTKSGVYQCTKVSSLQFVLAFPDQGAHLKLEVVGPAAAPIVKDGFSTFSIDVPAAAVGAWKYTVTPITLPNENFPFTVNVGAKK